MALKPSLTLDPSDGKITVAVGVEPSARLGAVAEAVEKAERQIRAAVHRHRAAWLDGEYTPERYSPKQLDELDRLTGRWLKDHARRTGRRRWPPYWRFLQVRTCALPTSRWTNHGDRGPPENGGEGGFPRWNIPAMCPLVSGLPPQEGESILERLSEIARAAKVPLASEHCRANLYVLVTTQPEALLRATETRNRLFTFGDDALPGVVDQFIARHVP